MRREPLDDLLGLGCKALENELSQQGLFVERGMSMGPASHGLNRSRSEDASSPNRNGHDES
jgi:hypothetical protein